MAKQDKNKSSNSAAPVWQAVKKSGAQNLLNRSDVVLGSHERQSGARLKLNGKFAIREYEGNHYVVYLTESGDEIPAKQLIGAFTGTRETECNNQKYYGTLDNAPEKYLAFSGLQSEIYDKILTALTNKTVEYLGSQVRTCTNKEGKNFVIKKHFWKQVD